MTVLLETPPSQEYYTNIGNAPLVWSPDGMYIASGPCIWDTHSGDLVTFIKDDGYPKPVYGSGPHGSHVLFNISQKPDMNSTSTAWSPDGARIAWGNIIYDARSGNILVRGPADDRTTFEHFFSDYHGRMLYSEGSRDCHTAWNANGVLIAAVWTGGNIYVWNSLTGEQIAVYYTTPVDSNRDTQIVWSADGAFVLYKTPSTIGVWNPFTGEHTQYPSHGGTLVLTHPFLKQLNNTSHIFVIGPPPYEYNSSRHLNKMLQTRKLYLFELYDVTLQQVVHSYTIKGLGYYLPFVFVDERLHIEGFDGTLVSNSEMLLMQERTRNGMVVLRDIKTGQAIAQEHMRKAEARYISSSPNGKRFASVGYKEVKIKEHNRFEMTLTGSTTRYGSELEMRIWDNILTP